MKHLSFQVCFLGLCLLMPAAVHSSEQEPSQTEIAQIDWDKHLCSEGINQSPVNIADVVEAVLDRVRFQYSTGASAPMELDSHVVFPPGNKAIVDHKAFELQKMYLRIPSEHLINGRSFAMEAQLLHMADDGDLLMIALLFELGTRNVALAKMFESASSTDDNEQRPAFQTKEFQPRELLPTSSSYYRYNGSLTTPPCTEGVRWIVMKTPLVAEQNQIDDLEERLGDSNNRPPQPLNARLVFK